MIITYGESDRRVKNRVQKWYPFKDSGNSQARTREKPVARLIRVRENSHKSLCVCKEWLPLPVPTVAHDFRTPTKPQYKHMGTRGRAFPAKFPSRPTRTHPCGLGVLPRRMGRVRKLLKRKLCGRKWKVTWPCCVLTKLWLCFDGEPQNFPTAVFSRVAPNRAIPGLARVPGGCAGSWVKIEFSAFRPHVSVSSVPWLGPNETR